MTEEKTAGKAASIIVSVEDAGLNLAEIVKETLALMRKIHPDKKIGIWQVVTNIKEVHGLSFPLEGENIHFAYNDTEKPSMYLSESYVEVIFIVT